MQPNQQQPDDQWQQPVATPGAAPYQAPVAEVPPAPSQPVEPVPSGPTVAAEPAVSEPITNNLETAEAPMLDVASAPDDDAALLRWESAEYVHHSRGAIWYVVFGLATLAAVAVAIFVVKSITFAILIPVMVLALLVYIRRAPDTIQYTLSRKGLHVNDKLYAYDLFKSFGIVTHNNMHSAILVPRKRFQLGQTVYFPEEIGEPLVDMLASRLPMKDLAPDAIDRLLAKLRL